MATTVHPHDVSPRILQCEYIIGYVFKNKNLADEALRVLCIADMEVYRVSWNTGLAILGRKVMEGLVCRMWWFAEAEHLVERWARISENLLSPKALADRARNLGFDKGIQLVLRQGEDGDSILATAVEAVLGAVFVDSGEEAVDRVLYGLGGEISTTVSGERIGSTDRDPLRGNKGQDDDGRQDVLARAPLRARISDNDITSELVLQGLRHGRHMQAASILSSQLGFHTTTLSPTRRLHGGPDISAAMLPTHCRCVIR
ncbi:hypothetical protein CC78DRAFT_585248 [Lojkania enalia]|uniref:RNase III domain-containing protein n=1 Tax=Lojkania enalia TaxID=147567 RepID=A0A9P4JZX2_9PLEO|nr:hypothetical protein CC78DRAFT_585248 [Didymosphaeria enalia]